MLALNCRGDNHRYGALLALAAALWLPACHSAPPPLQPTHPDAFGSIATDEFPGATELLAGFDARTDDGVWKADDKNLFALRLQRGDSVQRWLLLLDVMFSDNQTATLADAGIEFVQPRRLWSCDVNIDGESRTIPIESAMTLVKVSVHDAHGKQLGESTISLPRDLMAHGLLPAIESALRHKVEGRGIADEFENEATARPWITGIISLMALLRVVQNDEVLKDYFWLVVQKPSVWSVISELGIRASLFTPLEKSAPIGTLPGHIPPTSPAYAMPMRISVNDTPALLADVLVVGPGRPYSLCGGIIAASARHPTDNDLRLDIQLLAARNGSQQ